MFPEEISDEIFKGCQELRKQNMQFLLKYIFIHALSVIKNL